MSEWPQRLQARLNTYRQAGECYAGTQAAERLIRDEGCPPDVATMVRLVTPYYRCERDCPQCAEKRVARRSA